MIGKSFYAKCRVLEPGAHQHRVAPVIEQPAVEQPPPVDLPAAGAELKPVREGQASSSSGPAAAPLPAPGGQAVPGPREILGPQSSVEELRNRLRELKKLGVVDAVIHGTKAQLHERLVKV